MADFNVEKVEQEILEEERIRRYQAEVKIYFLMKEFTDQWKENIVKGIGKVIEEKWHDELNMQAVCDFNLIEILKKKLYVTTYIIKSDRVVESDLNLFYYH